MDSTGTKTDAIPRRPAGAPTELSVTVAEGPNAGRTASLPSVATLGRARAADLRLDDAAVSEFHVELSAREDGVLARDLMSLNGTFYGGARFESALLPPGSMLALGRSVVRLDPSTAVTSANDALTSFGALRGSSAPMRALYTSLARVAVTDLSVLIEGPTGSGKELAALALHEASTRAAAPFVVLDCTTIPPALAESVLFGHQRGAFTGAQEARPGIFEAAEGGTVFLDEIGDLPLELQAKLLRVLGQGTVTRVGSNAARPVDVRVVAATWRDLRQMINQGKFREDLYYRVAQARVLVPPLDARHEDIETLVFHFLARLPKRAPGARAISREALSQLRSARYPGNVRELKSAVERAAAMAAGNVITPADLMFERMLAQEGSRARDHGMIAMVETDDGNLLPDFKRAKRTAIDDFERAYLERLLARTDQNLSQAAGFAAIERHYLRALLRKHGLRGED